MRILKHSIIIGLLFLCVSHFGYAQTPTQAPFNGNYNVLLVVTDQERYFETPPAGTDWRARNLLQSNGITFRKHYISSNMCSPSRAVMYTGQHITATKIADNTDVPWQDALSVDIPTIGHLMREAGYYTAYKGKFHISHEGAIEISGQNSDNTGQNTETQQQDALEIYGFSDWNFEGEVAGSMLEGYHKDEYIKSSSVRWLRDRGASLNESGVPFFLAVNFINPHDIMFYNPDGQQTAQATNTVAPNNTIYTRRYDYIPPAWEHESDIPAHREFLDGWKVMFGATPRDRELVKQFNDYYLNCIQDQDNSMMGLLDELERLGMMENTIIIFTSDHGEMGGSHGLKGKGPFMYNNKLHVPFIVVHPAYEGSRFINAITSHIDIVPTILDLVNLSDAKKRHITSGLVGHSLVPLLNGEAKSVRDGALYVYSMLATVDSGFNLFSVPVVPPDLTKRGLLRGIVTERYKFSRYFSPLNFNTPTTLDDLYNNNDVELYDLETDPNELSNLAADRVVYAELIEEMNRRLNELIEQEIGIDSGDEVTAGLNFFGIKQ